MIEARALTVGRGSFRLENVSIHLPTGAWGMVTGPTGAGKTTLLEAIAGVRRAQGGSVLLRDVDVTQTPPEQRRVGMVYQHAYLFPHLDVADNIAFGAGDAAASKEIARHFGVEPLLSRRIASLSGGERQLVALARALAPRPDIVLLDEPFSALDARAAARAREQLRALRSEWGLTILQVTHDLEESRTVGDTVVVLEQGRLIPSGERA